MRNKVSVETPSKLREKGESAGWVSSWVGPTNAKGKEESMAQKMKSLQEASKEDGVQGAHAARMPPYIKGEVSFFSDGHSR